jgi:hypothetical protein
MVVLENERYSITSSNCVERSVGKSSNVKHDHGRGSLISQSAPVFIICERCHWCATYLDTNRILQEEKVDDDNNKICPRCDTIDSLSSLPILSNESFTFDYSVKRGIVLQFKKRD